MLLGTLLLTSLAAHSQEWAGGLPLDSTSGKIVFQGSEVVPETPAAVLRKRAITYARNSAYTSARSLVVVDSAQAITLLVFVRPSLFDLHYQLTVLVTNGSYHYSLFDFGYTIRVGEGFMRGRIVSKEPNRQVAAEVMWQDARQGYPSFRPTFQKQLAEAAEQGIAQLQAAMQ